MPAAAEDLGPLVEAGSGGGKHDEVFLLQAQPAHSRCGVEAARPREDLPRDGEGEALVLQLPDMRGESGAWLVAVPAISLVLGNPVPHGALREACVGLLLASGGVGDLRPIDYSLRHAVTWQWTLPASSVAIAPSTGLHTLRPHLVVVLVEGLAHVGHGRVGDLHGVAVDHLPQLVAWRKTGVNEGQELLSDVGGDGLGEWRVEPGDCPASRLGAGSL